MRKFALAILIALSVRSISQTFQDSLRINPDPFVKHTNIFFSFANHDTVSLNIYQNVGQLVNIINLLTDSVMPAGAYSDSLFMDAYPDGTYYALLKLGHRKTIMKPFVKSSISGLKQESIREPAFYCFPNPANNVITFGNYGADFLKAHVYIVALNGKILLSQSFQQTMSIGHLPEGAYEVRVVTDSKNISFRIIKQ